MKLVECTHFKMRGQWFYVAKNIRSEFLRAFESQIREALLLESDAGPGNALAWPSSTKLHYATDLAKYCIDNNLQIELEKAFDVESLQRVRAKLMVKQIKGPERVNRYY